MFYKLISLLCIAASLAANAQQVAPEKPAFSTVDFAIDNIPESELNVPIQVDLRPFYAMADKQVDTLFTSPGFPNDWVQAGCDTRYKYSFRRGPLKFDFKNNKLDIGFTGYYKIVGSTRACVNGAAITPWTPECKCGFDEAERRVNISYTITPVVLINYVVKLQIVRNEPVPVDKCTVCFWGQDITPTIMESLKTELDLSKADMEKSYGRIDLKPQFQNIWNQLSNAYAIEGMGWLQINPSKVRLNRLYGSGDKLHINIGLAARPVVRFERPDRKNAPIPTISNFSRTPGFNINVDAVLDYDSLSNILTKQIAGKEFVFKKSFINKKFVFQECELMGAKGDRLVMKVKFSGTDNGFFYVTGKPRYDAATKTLSVSEVDFDLKSRDALLKTADWLFSRKITNEIEKMGRYDLRPLVDSTRLNIQQQLNREFIKGMRGSGIVTDINISTLYPQEDKLVVRVNTTGNLALTVSEMDFSL